MKELLATMLQLAEEGKLELAGASDNGSVPWRQVKGFLVMAAAALRARSIVLERLQADSNEAAASSREETTFLEEELRGLMEERSELQQRLNHLQRERDSLAKEVQLLRDQIQGRSRLTTFISETFVGKLFYQIASGARADDRGPSPNSLVHKLRLDLAAETARRTTLESQVAELTGKLQKQPLDQSPTSRARQMPDEQSPDSCADRASVPAACTYLF